LRRGGVAAEVTGGRGGGGVGDGAPSRCEKLRGVRREADGDGREDGICLDLDAPRLIIF
jgi:hypothetical protein